MELLKECAIDDQPFRRVISAHGMYYANGMCYGKHMAETYDPAKNSLGHPSDWPETLKIMVSLALTNPSPICLCYGRDLLMYYNDGYAKMLSEDKRRDSFGKPIRDVFPEAWENFAKPLMFSVMDEGRAVYAEDQILFLYDAQADVLCERYFTFSYSPICINTNNGVEGVFVVVNDTTSGIIGRRQLQLLQELASRSPQAFTKEDACKLTMEGLSTNNKDMPFAALYLANEKSCSMVNSIGLPNNFEIAPAEIHFKQVYHSDVAKAIQDVYQTREMIVVDVSALKIPECGHWNKSPVKCAVLPIVFPGRDQSFGVVVLAISQVRVWDEGYQSFFRLIGNQVGTTFSNAAVHEEERARLDQLAKFDRAKTTFFTNISHEFRTPLTLMLGPLEELLAKRLESSDTYNTLQVVHRNTLRLFKLVNTLLDFSRIEAGRMTASYVPTDIAKYTDDLASIFRSACESAGLQYVVICKQLSQLVYVDRDMWEKIVLNLISNAFKYTLQGKIEVTVQEIENGCELTVTDTGIGIPEEHLPRLFERFYRIPGNAGRAIEGTGIGLALVSELVKLHSGSISCTSVFGKGSTFKITLPFGSKHLPTSSVEEAEDYTVPDEYSQNLSWWLPNAATHTNSSEGNNSTDVSKLKLDDQRFRVLVVEDNADMREYVTRLLKNLYIVDVAVDGYDAYTKAVNSPPHLILSDIMMPKLDGIELLQKLRDHPRTRTIPVILLSARAGQEMLTGGLERGADDYLIKPFTAPELLARIRAHIEMSQFRVEVTKLEQANEAKDHFLAVLSHELRTPLTPVLLLAESLESQKGLPPNIRDDISLIKRNIALEVRLISDLLDLTKISKGKLEMHLEDVSIYELVKYAMKLLEHDIAEKSMVIKQNFKADHHYVRGDSSRIQQILWNLLKNAIKFTPNEGTITIDIMNPAPQKIRVCVTDTGKGIDPEFLPRMFSSFEQEKGARQFGGLGLGLSISRVIATMHNGSLVASSPGINQGATFTLELPTVTPHNIQHTNSNELPKLEATSMKILVVEDNKPTLLVLQRFLKRLDHQVKTASSVAEALEIATEMQGEFDLVISDIGLPDGSGLELMKTLKSQYKLHGIALSGYGMEEDVRKSLLAGFDIHLTKPVQMAVLSAALGQVQKRKEQDLGYKV